MTVAVLAALATGLLVQPAVIRLMLRAAVIDVPGHRSSHVVPTPRGGGIAVLLALSAGLTLLGGALLLLVPVLLFAVIGLAEDIDGLPVGVRLGIQVLAGVSGGALLATADHAPAQLVRLGGQDGAVVTVLAIAVACWLVAYVNAFNFMDGVNGIAAAHAAVAGLALAAVSAVLRLPLLTGSALVVSVAALSFLPWNAGRPRIFLGDVGSYGLGAAVGALVAYAVLHGVPVEAAVAPVALQAADTGWTLARRIRAGEPWHRAHRSHVYQRLTDAGWSHQRVTAVTAAAAAGLSLLGAVSLLGSPLARVLADTAAIAALGLYLRAPKLLARRVAASEPVMVAIDSGDR